MEAARRRFESFVEWALAVSFIAALLGIGSVVVREIRTVNAVTPVIAREPTQTSPVPAGVPSRAVSVPILLLEDGNQVRIGDSAAAITSRLGRQAEVRAPDDRPRADRRAADSFLQPWRDTVQSRVRSRWDEWGDATRRDISAVTAAAGSLEFRVLSVRAALRISRTLQPRRSHG